MTLRNERTKKEANKEKERNPMNRASDSSHHRDSGNLLDGNPRRDPSDRGFKSQRITMIMVI